MDDKSCTYQICLLLLCISVNSVHHVQCQTATDAKNLKAQLFTTEAYDYKIRPTNNQSVPIDVYVDFYILSINSLSETQETLMTTGYLLIQWTDELLQWDPVDYGGLEYYFWPQNDIWKPDVALKNSYLDYKQLGVSTLNVESWNDGTIYWYPFQVFVSTCSVDITYFPYDIQTCKLKFVAWSYTEYEISMLSGTKGIVLDEYESNPEWDVLETDWDVLTESGEANIVFTLKIQRKPLYVVLSVIMPIVMLSLLNIFVFVLPCNSGERAGYAITVFLAFAVFLTIVTSSLPENSETVAIFSVYIILQTIQSTCITLLALIMLRCHSFEESRAVPKWLTLITNVLTCKICRNLGKKNQVTDECVTNVVSKEAITRINVVPAVQPIKHKEFQETPAIETTMTWTKVISTFDIVFFVLFGVNTVLSPMLCFLISMTASV